MQLRRVGRPEGLTQAVRNEIERLIVSANLKPGSKLPTEKELVEQLGVGRSSIREALRALQEVGMVEVVQGKGTFVRNRSGKAIEAHLQFLINFEDKPYQELMELRRLLEVGLVQLAAERSEEEDLNALRELLQAMAGAETSEALTKAGAAFHLAVARAAKNAFITSIYEAVTQVINQVYSAFERSPAQKRQSIRDHEEIYRALADHDPELAMQKATEHLANLGRDFGGQGKTG